MCKFFSAISNGKVIVYHIPQEKKELEELSKGDYSGQHKEIQDKLNELIRAVNELQKGRV
jgi:hypothetical protein